MTVARAAEPATFSLNGLELRQNDGSARGPFTLEVRAQRVALIGDFDWWSQLLARRAHVLRGDASVVGMPFERALQQGVLGWVPLDPALPSAWSVTQYLTESAALLGRGRSFTRSAVSSAIARFELSHLSKARLGNLRVAEQRVLLLAAATLSQPTVVCCEAPLFRLDDDAAEYVETALTRATDGIRCILTSRFGGDDERERVLLSQCESWITLRDNDLTEQAPTQAVAGASHALVTVAQNPEAFEAALSARGLLPRRVGQADVLRLLLEAGVGAEYVRFLLAVPDEEAQRAVFEASLEAKAPLVQYSMERDNS